MKHMIRPASFARDGWVPHGGDYAPGNHGMSSHGRRSIGSDSNSKERRFVIPRGSTN